MYQALILFSSVRSQAQIMKAQETGSRPIRNFQLLRSSSCASEEKRNSQHREKFRSNGSDSEPRQCSLSHISQVRYTLIFPQQSTSITTIQFSFANWSLFHIQRTVSEGAPKHPQEYESLFLSISLSFLCLVPEKKLYS